MVGWALRPWKPLRWWVGPVLLAVVGVGGGSAMAFELQSAAFTSGVQIPAKHTCDGRDTSPQLRWSDPPPNTRSFALIMDDPDAPGGTWVHWVLYAIAATVHTLPEGVAMRDSVAGVGIQGMNDFQRVGYGGPCPPKGPAHRYSFTLYAVDTDLHLPPRKTKTELRKAMDGHILAQTELVGRYTRR